MFFQMERDGAGVFRRKILKIDLLEALKWAFWPTKRPFWGFWSKLKMAISRARGHRFGPGLMRFGGFRGCRIRIWTLEGPTRPVRGRNG